MHFPRSSYWYTVVVRDECALIVRLRDLAFARVRFGYRRLTVLLQREGRKVGRRRVQRLYQTEGLMVRTKWCAPSTAGCAPRSCVCR